MATADKMGWSALRKASFMSQLQRSEMSSSYSPLQPSLNKSQILFLDNPETFSSSLKAPEALPDPVGRVRVGHRGRRGQARGRTSSRGSWSAPWQVCRSGSMSGTRGRASGLR
ncbi:hypothetical protein CRENBAI_012063 [Crenichthys baileyi]|uniref:Uncharacterized protein n=1 Tax=Crenichthys baileyi TaxID=28760 RepID=A0AAV9RM60_9TELE